MRYLSLALLFCLSGCGGSSSSSQAPSSTTTAETSVEESSFSLPTGESIKTDENELTQSTDKYRTMYQIFPYSFADGDGDGVGDLWGAADKLEYIHDLHYEGVWLTPVCPSPSYHKYDITDYYDIDEAFGGLDAFDAFVEKAHSLGMTVVFDLVLNHSALSHEWFSYCADAVANEDTTNPYYGYYNIKEGTPTSDWYNVPGHSGFIYEGVFYSGMPDIKLQSVLDEPEGYLAQEIQSICKYWLKDHNVDGFRLDAVTSYFTGDQNSNLAFLTWLDQTCEAIKPGCYIVGEGSWTGDSSENLKYQGSGVDSFFNFVHTGVSSAYSIPKMISGQSAGRFAFGLEQAWKVAGEGMPASFVANHDTTRLTGLVAARTNPVRAKIAHSMLALLPGASYNYYGDEIGMCIPTGSSDNDPDRRLHMDWGDTYTPNDPPGHSSYSASSKAYPYANVAEQLADEDSILNHVRKVNALRQMFPEIARGTTESLGTVSSSDEMVTAAAFTKKTADSSIVVVINPSYERGIVYDFSTLGDVKPVAEVSAVGESTYSGKELYLQPGAVVILK